MVEERLEYQRCFKDRHLLAPDVQKEMRAIDVAVATMREDPAFEFSFQRRGCSWNDVFYGVSTLEDLLVSVAVNTEGDLYDQRNVQDWGKRILAQSVHGVCNGDRDVAMRLKEFVVSERELFGIDLH